MKNLGILFLLSSLALSSQAAMIGLNFVAGRSAAGGNGSGGGQGEIVLAADVAGVVPQANWNNGFGSNNALPLALVNDAGALTPATATWSGVPNSWTQSGAVASDGNERLMNGYLDTNASSTTTIVVNNVPYATYDVYIYKDGDGFNRSGNYSVNGVLQTNLGEVSANGLIGPPPGDMVFSQALSGGPNGNYALFSGLSGATATITGTPFATRAPINGIQIVGIAVGGVPEPSSLLQFAVVLGGLLFVRRRRAGA